MLREHGFWGQHPQFHREMGLLSGANGDIVKPLTLRGQLSTGLLWKLPAELAHLPDTTDVADRFGIVDWIPPVPKELLAISSEERRVGKECVSTCRFRWWPVH